MIKACALAPLSLVTRPLPAEGPQGAGAEAVVPEWQPAFLSWHENETLILLSDWILPDTETPGAKVALVNRFIDLVLAAEAHPVQASFLQSLNALDQECLRRHGVGFRFLNRAEQKEVLDTASANNSGDLHAHFESVKAWVSRAFYTSEIGMRELGWNGMPPHGTLSGC